MLFVTTSDKYFYHVLYPPGWCIVPTMETKHHQLWSGTVQEILHLDSLGRILVQLIIIFQVIRVIISMSTENIHNCRLIVMREIKTGQIKKMLDTEKE